MEPNEVAAKIVDAAFKIHVELGPVLLETVCEGVLTHELRKRDLRVRRQVPVPMAVLRTSFIPSSLVSRIRPNRVCLAGSLARPFYGLSFRFQWLSTPGRQDAVTFNSWWEVPPQRDFHPPMHAPSQAHQGRLAEATVLARTTRGAIHRLIAEG
jgi:hypothetical protein